MKRVNLTNLILGDSGSIRVLQAGTHVLFELHTQTGELALAFLYLDLPQKALAWQRQNYAEMCDIGTAKRPYSEQLLDRFVPVEKVPAIPQFRWQAINSTFGENFAYIHPELKMEIFSQTDGCDVSFYLPDGSEAVFFHFPGAEPDAEDVLCFACTIHRDLGVRSAIRIESCYLGQSLVWFTPTLPLAKSTAAACAGGFHAKPVGKAVGKAL